MTDQPKSETVETTSQNEVPENTESGRPKSRIPELFLAFVLFAGILTVAVNVISTAHEQAMQERSDRQAEVDAESAYYDVMLNRVALNGERGTSTWRAYYRIALERVLASHDFSDACSSNGFLKETTSPNTVPCIAVGDVRAVRAADGSVRYFKEQTSARLTVALDVMEQDVHAPDYLDIDKFSTALGDRARRLVQKVEDRKRAKERAEQEASLEQTRLLVAESKRIVAETERLLGRRIVPLVPPGDFEEGLTHP